MIVISVIHVTDYGNYGPNAGIVSIGVGKRKRLFRL